MSTEGGTKAVIAAMIANAGIAATKFAAFAITGSSSMLSEAIHSVADTGNQILLLLGGKRSLEAPDDLHQFGYGRRRYVYSFVVAIILFLLGGLFSLYEGYHKISHPEPLEKVWVAYAVLFMSIALEAWSFKTAFGEANKSRGKRSLLQYIRDSRQPELPVVLLEDLGALVGLVLAVCGITAAVATGNPKWDGVGALAIGTLLLIIAIFLAFEVSGLLVGESALPDQEDAIRAALGANPLIERIIHMRTLHTGPDELLVGVKIAVAPGTAMAQLAAAIDEAELGIRAAVPTARWVYVEPDVDRGDPARGTGA
jgi:cation diffusion facilitator family transporter